MTTYADIPLTAGILTAAAAHFGVALPAARVRRLHGGEESAAYRAGDHVVRIGPAWRGDERIEWCHAGSCDQRRDRDPAVAVVRGRREPEPISGQ